MTWVKDIGLLVVLWHGAPIVSPLRVGRHVRVLPSVRHTAGMLLDSIRMVEGASLCIKLGVVDSTRKITSLFLHFAGTC